MDLKIYPLLLIAVGALAGAGFGFLQACRTPERFRSTATFRVVANAGSAGDLESTVGFGSLNRAGEAFRSREVISKAVADGGLNGLPGLGNGQASSVVDLLQDSRALLVEIVGFSLTEVMVQVSLDTLDAATSQQVLEALLASYRNTYFSEDDETPLATQRAQWKRADEVLEQLEALEAQYSDWLIDNADGLGDDRSPDDLRQEAQDLKAQQDRLSARVGDLQRRLAEVASARDAGVSLTGLLKLLESDSSDFVAPVVVESDAEALARLRKRILEVQQQVFRGTEELHALGQQIATTTELARERIRRSVSQQDLEQRLTQSREEYDRAVQRLRKSPEAAESELKDSARFAILRAPGPGVPFGPSVADRLLLGSLWGAGITLLMSVLAAALLAFQRRRVSTVSWEY